MLEQPPVWLIVVAFIFAIGPLVFAAVIAWLYARTKRAAIRRAQ